MKRIFLFAGEKSGDEHGAKLMKSLKKKCPDAKLYGVGGPKMRAEGLNCILEMEKFEVMGFLDVFLNLPKLIRSFYFLRNHLLKDQPDLTLFIDYAEFNLSMEKSLKKRGFKGKVCHYISPTVWAWRKNRIKKMEKNLDTLFVIFPFEKELFDPKKLNVHYVGHPLVENLQKSQASLDIDPEKKVVAIFPGSRVKELMRNFPIQLKIAKKLTEKHHNLLFVVSVAAPSFSLLLEKLMNQEKINLKDQLLFVSSDQNPKLMKRANLAIAKSGTNNLELALNKVPTVVTYGISPLDYFIAWHLLRIRLPHYCIVNILSKQTVFPELIGTNLTEEKLYKELDLLLSSQESYDLCREKCTHIAKMLEDKIPEEEISSIIKNLIDEIKKPV